MWPTIDRARRRLSGALVSSADPTTPPAGRPVEDVVITFGAVELDQLRGALQLLLGDAVERPDTPARIERALGLLLVHRGAPGVARVLRRPAGLSTPEAWEIHLDGVDHATSAAIREAGRTGVLA
jgi:hypothetical protein